MDTTESTQQPRQVTLAELAATIKLLREMRQWSQEQLAEIAGVNVRTIQRVEQGVSASFDTRRALATAFDCEDIDIFNRPLAIPTEEEIKTAKEKFDREHVTMKALRLPRADSWPPWRRSARWICRNPLLS